jgi:hypothetical protein
MKTGVPALLMPPKIPFSSTSDSQRRYSRLIHRSSPESLIKSSKLFPKIIELLLSNPRHKLCHPSLFHFSQEFQTIQSIKISLLSLKSIIYPYHHHLSLSFSSINHKVCNMKHKTFSKFSKFSKANINSIFRHEIPQMAPSMYLDHL